MSDIGSFFEKMKRQARGGRRLDDPNWQPSPAETHTTSGTTTPIERQPAPTTPTRTPAPRTGTGTGGGLGDLLKDMLNKGRAGAKTTTERVRERIPTRQQRTHDRRRKELPSDSVVTIEYSPQRDNDPDPGEVVWAWVPFDEDPEQGKDRPVVIVGRRGDHLVGVPLTTKQKDHEAQVALGTGGWDPKRRQSYARVWRLLNIDENKVRRESVALDQARFEQLVRALDEYYDIRTPAPAAPAQDYDY